MIDTLFFLIQNDLDLLSGDFFDLLQQDDLHTPSKLTTTSSTSHPNNNKIHSDHDYYAQRSPGQHSDSGVSVNSLDDSAFMTNMADDQLQCLGVSGSPQAYQSVSSPPLSDAASDSNPLGLEDFDFSTCMDFGDVDSPEGLNMDSGDLELVSTKDTDVSIDFGRCFFPDYHLSFL